MLFTGDLVTSGPKLLPRTMSGVTVLQQLESVLISMAHATKGAIGTIRAEIEGLDEQHCPLLSLGELALLLAGHQSREKMASPITGGPHTLWRWPYSSPWAWKNQPHGLGIEELSLPYT